MTISFFLKCDQAPQRPMIKTEKEIFIGLSQKRGVRTADCGVRTRKMRTHKMRKLNMRSLKMRTGKMRTPKKMIGKKISKIIIKNKIKL